MSKLAFAISTIVRTFAQRRRAKVGLIFNGNRKVAEMVVACGQKTLVLSNRFHPLFKLLKSFRANGDAPSRRTVLMVETRLDALPLALRSLDVLVLSSGLPETAGISEVLATLRGLLKPHGLLVWTHPSAEGAAHKVFSRIIPGLSRRGRGMRRPDLCRTAMAAGFYEVGQTAVSQTFGNWVVTTGRRGLRPWEGASNRESTQ
jgi:hypothetical protein